MANQVNAAAGFGEYCKKKGITFDIPFVGKIGIGMEYADVLDGFADTCERKLDVQWEGGDCILSDENGSILSFSTKGIYVTGIKYEGLTQQIPAALQYGHKGKTYVTDEKIEGYMLFANGTQEIKLQAAKGVPCVEHTAADFGASPKKRTREYASIAAKAQQRLSSVAKGKPCIKAGADVQALAGSYEAAKAKAYSLHLEIAQAETPANDLKMQRSKAWREYQTAQDGYKQSLQVLAGTYARVKFPFDPPLDELMEKGKIIKDARGMSILSPGASNDVSYTKETKREWMESSDLTIPSGWHYYGNERREVPMTEEERNPFGVSGNTKKQLESLYGYGAAEYETVFHMYRDYEVTVAHEDKAYQAACHWVNSKEYHAAYKKACDSYSKMAEAEKRYGYYGSKLEEYEKSPEYAAKCAGLGEKRAKLKEAEAEKETARQKLWEDGELSDFGKAVEDLSAYANAPSLQ